MAKLVYSKAAILLLSCHLAGVDSFLGPAALVIAPPAPVACAVRAGARDQHSPS